MLTDLTGFQRDLLTVVAATGPATGIEIKEHLQAELAFDEVHHGRLYPNLDTLVDKGLLHKRQRDRRTNEYELAARGERRIRQRVKWEVTSYDFLIDN